MANLVLKDGPGRVKLPLARQPCEIVIAVPEMPLGDAPFPLRVGNEALEQVRLPEDGKPGCRLGIGVLLSDFPQRVGAPVRSG